MEKIGVFYGGKSCEHEVSVITALSVMAELEGKYEVVPIYMCDKGWFSGELLKKAEFYKSFDENLHVRVVLDGGSLKTRGFLGLVKEYARIDVALVCAHGGAGEGGGLSGLLEINGIPYTCSEILPSAICLNKEYFKLVARQKGFSVVPGVTVSKKDVESAKTIPRIIKKYGEDLVVKPVDLGSSVGVSVASGEKELKEAIDLGLCYSKRVLIEKQIKPLVEYNCAGMRVGTEIIISAIEKPEAKGDILSYSDKYLNKDCVKSGKKALDIPYKLANKIRKTTYRLYDELELSGVVRIDYIYDPESDDLYVNEANTVPGSLSCGLFSECGMSTCMLVDSLIMEAKDRFNEKNQLISHFSSELLSGEYTVSKS